MSETVVRPLRVVHRWIGLALAIPLMIQGATGFIMAVSPAFEALQVPSPGQPAEPPHGVGAIIAAARTAAPAGLVLLRYQAGTAPGDTAVVDLTEPSERIAEIRFFVDPGSLAILDWRDRPDEFYAWVHRLHETFLVPGPPGHALVGWCGIGLFCLGISGVPIWWPRRGRWKAAFSLPWKTDGYQFQRGLHGAAGGWVVAFLILQSLSGASMAFPGFFGAMLGAPAARIPAAAAQGGHDATHRTTPDIDLDVVAGALRTAAPNARLTSLRFPTQPGRPLIATLTPVDEAHGAPPIVVFANSSDGHIISVRDPRRAGTGADILAWLRALHSGDGLGFIWRTAVCLLGIALLLFPITGMAMWLLRRRERRRRSVAQNILQGASE